MQDKEQWEREFDSLWMDLSTKSQDDEIDRMEMKDFIQKLITEAYEEGRHHGQLQTTNAMLEIIIQPDKKE